jgi:hypothetical protein
MHNTALSLRFGLTFAGALALGACSFLVQFDDVPGGACDGGLCADAEAGSRDRGGDEPAQSDVLDEDAAAAPDQYAPCANNVDGYYCATDGLHGYDGSPNDLVFCQEGGVGKVVDCDAGCLALPAPFPDACNPCGGKADGTYCGRDLAGFPATDADFLLQCQSGNAVQKVACPHGCQSKPPMSACYAQ